MWPTFKTEHPIEMHPVLDGDMRLATLAFGFTIGFGYFVSWHAIKQTKKTRRWSAYIIMCWLEIIVCLIFAIICWLYLCGIIGYSFWFYFSILTTWALQVQFLLQIIVNRICILLPTPSQRFWLKFIVATWITAINISVYCIWVPAKLQISTRYHDINVVWDRMEKCFYLLTDGILNWMFVNIIKKRLVSMGLKKYDRLVKFNERIIMVSLSMDVLIIGMMSYRNDFVYMQFHPVAYMVKLEIEMCMSRLMVKVATSTGVQVYEEPDLTTSGLNSSSRDRRVIHSTNTQTRSVNVHIATQVVTHTDNEVDHEAHELEERDRKDRGLDDIEHGFRTNTIDLVPEDDADRESNADTLRKQAWESNQALSSIPTPPPAQGWSVDPEERRTVTFGPTPESRPATGNGNGNDAPGTYVSYLGTQHVRVLHSTRERDGANTP
ncbi:Es2 domain-containing protein [Ceratobasidium sp. AG-Ba]|nr:Es2 domain-containing protein [Ceratobasidium sp. AG-Ba]